MVQYPMSVDRAFTALADPTRRAVLERLGAGSATISELAEPFGMSLTGMKKHIRLLEEANLVATEKVGRARRCALVLKDAITASRVLRNTMLSAKFHNGLVKSARLFFIEDLIGQ